MKKFIFVFIAGLTVLLFAGCQGAGLASDIPASDPVTYTVTYDGNGNTGGAVPVDGSYEAGVSVTVLDNTGSLVKGEETFSGWNTEPDGTGTNRAAGSTYSMGSANVTLYAKWLTYSLRDTGPAGGLVFYDKGSYSDGWRYLEAAPVSTEWVGKEYGTYSSYVADAIGTLIGDGKNNTISIVEWLNNNSDDSHGDVTYKTERAAFLCDTLSIQNEDVTYADWFLPSVNELLEVYTELFVNGVGGFASNWYWSSSEGSANSAKRVEFNNGGVIFSPNKNNMNYVRAIRAF